MGEPTRADQLATLQGAFAGVSAGDADQMLEHYTEDLVLELPYADPPTVLEGRETVRAYLRGAFEVFRFRLEVTEVHECADPDKLVVEYVGEGQVTTTGKAYANAYIGVYWFRDGRIARVREFYNPLPAARALSAD